MNKIVKYCLFYSALAAVAIPAICIYADYKWDHSQENYAYKMQMGLLKIPDPQAKIDADVYSAKLIGNAKNVPGCRNAILSETRDARQALEYAESSCDDRYIDIIDANTNKIIAACE